MKTQILYIEDSTPTAELVKVVLNPDKYFVRVVETGIEGQKLFDKEKFDIVMIDYKLPDTTGLELVTHFRKKDLNLPLILVTAKGSEEVAVKAFRNGATDYIIKNDSFINTLPTILANAERKYKKTLSAQEAKENLILSKEREIKSERFLFNVANATPDPIFIKNSEKKWILVNDSMCEFLGLPRNEIIGKTSYDFFPKEQADIFWESDKRVFKSGETVKDLEKVTLPSGNSKIISTKKSIFYEETSGEKLLIGTIRDITEQKILEDKIEKMRRENSSFQRHELKNLLSPIRGFAEILGSFSQNLNEKEKDFAGRIVSSVDHIVNLIDELKVLEDYEMKNIQLYLTISDITRAIDNTIIDLESFTSAGNISIKVNNMSTNPNVELDMGLIHNVFKNLIQNAAEHVYKLEDYKSKIIKIDIENIDNDIDIKINNQGRTLSENFLKIFFEKFNTNRQEKKSGTGLGTTYAKIITETHGGRITVDSNDNDGTTVTLTFPSV